MRTERAVLAVASVLALVAPARALAQTAPASGGVAATPATDARRVLVLRFGASGGGTTSALLDSVRGATRTAVTGLGDALPTDAEVAAAEAQVKDGVADTSAEFRAAGRGAKTGWVVAGHVDAHGATYRLELEACQVSTGRVESLAREVDASQATAQIGEMLALLLRPQGVGDIVPPWDEPNAPPKAPPPVTAPPPPAPAPQPVVATAPPPPPPSPGPPPPQYAEGRPLALGVGGAALDAFQRASDARGSATAGLLTVHGGYGVQGALHGLEVVADMGIAVAGPSSFTLAGGLRYELAIVPSARVYLGPEVEAGAFVVLGGDKDARFLIVGSLPIVVGIGSRVQIEAYPELAYAAGGTAGLGFVGGGLRAVVRF
jgi:hypothetical protein